MLPGSLLASLLAIEGVLFLSSFSVLWFFLFSAVELRYTDRNYKKHIRNFSKMTYRIINSSPGSGQHIAVILFWGSIIVLIALSFRSKFKKKDLAKGIGKPLPSKISKDLANPYTLKLQTQDVDLMINNPFRGILCIGSAGSGKSESILRQLMKSAIDNEFCGIIYDFKSPTLTNELEGFLSQKTSRFKHYNINFNDLRAI